MTSGATAIRWLFLIIAFLLFVWFVTGKYNESKKEEKSTTTTSPPATKASAPVQGKTSECTTPCTIRVRHRQSLWTDEQSVKFRKKGESEWTILTGNENVDIPSGDLEVVGYPDEKKQIFIEAAGP